MGASSETQSEKGYREVLEQAHLLRTLAQGLASGGAIDEALERIERADSVGSILDPTAYMANRDRMIEDRDTLRAVRALAQLGGDG